MAIPWTYIVKMSQGDNKYTSRGQITTEMPKRRRRKAVPAPVVKKVKKE